MERVLIIEENEKIARFLKKRLAENGFTVIIADSLERVKDLLNEYKKHYMAVIADLKFSAMASKDLLDYISAFDLPTIALTGSVTKDTYKLLNNKDILDFCIRNKKEELEYVVKLLDNMKYYSSLTALVVDDSATARMIVSKQLKLMQFKVIEASDGVEALKVLEKNKNISLVVTDFNMPNMDGIELTVNIRKEYTKEQLIIVALTAVDTPENTAAFLKYGASGFIAKPLSKETFNYTINNAMELNRVIHKNKEYSKTINENIPFVKVDEDFLITDVSCAYEKISGYKKEELLAKDYSTTFNDKDTYGKVLSEIISEGIYKGEVEGKRENTDPLNYKLSIVQTTNSKGEMNGIFDIREDITDSVIKRKQEESLLEQSKFTAMGDLLKDIAHQWRQPLNVISLQMETLLMFHETGELNDTLMNKTHKDIGEQLNYLTDTINSFSAYFAKSRKVDSVDLLTLMQDTTHIFRSILEEKGIDISVEGDNFSVDCDRDRMSQTIIYILNNAVDAIEKIKKEDEEFKGNISINVDSNKKQVTIYDNGIGIEKEIKESIFNPYFTTKFKDRGVGLSLYLTKMIVEESGGKITFNSEKNSTNFYLNF